MPRQVNWSATFASNPFSEVRDVNFDMGGQLLTGKADTDIYPTAKKQVTVDPTVTITSEDGKNVAAHPVGAEGSLVITNLGAKIAGDGVRYTIANAVVANHSHSGPHAGWGQVQTRFECYSADGITSPVTISAPT